MRWSNKGQLTIFIVVGVLIVGAIGFYFIFRQGLIPDIGGGQEVNPNSFLEACLEEKIEEAVDILSMQGGSLNPKLFERFKFSDDDKPYNISYLCYNQNSYDRCINQVPMLINYIETEIEDYINNDVTICFDELENNLQKQNYEIKKEYNGFEINLEFDKVILEIDGKLELTKSGETTIQKNIGAIFSNNIYNLLLIAHDIVKSESQYCDFNKQSYMMIYSDILIKLFSDSEGIKFYRVQERDIDKSFRFAVRGCIIE
jgi:hypothetical protein